MNTFKAAMEVSGTSEITKIVNWQKAVPLLNRIQQRGEREQRFGRLLAHYYPESAKRVFKSRTLFNDRTGQYVSFYPVS